MSTPFNNNNNGGPAFPMTGEGCHNPLYSQPGMTLRDYFAGQVLAGSVDPTSAIYGNNVIDLQASLIAASAYKIAEAMLAARDAKPMSTTMQHHNASTEARAEVEPLKSA